MYNNYTVTVSDGNSTLSELTTYTYNRDIRILSREESQIITEALFWLYGPFYCTVGAIGVTTNIINMIALSKSLKLATYKIFLAMACADFMVMLTFLLFSLSFGVYQPPKIYLGVPGINLKPWVTYSFYLWKRLCLEIANPFMCISNWCSVLVTMFRLLAISLPLQTVRYSRPAVINSCIVIVYVLGFIAQVPHWISFRFDQHGALNIVTQLEKYGSITLFLNGVIPLGLCALATVVLIIQLARSHEKIHGSITGELFEQRKREQKQLSITLLLIAIFFIILNIPSTVYYLMHFTNSFSEISQFKEQQFYIAQNAASVISYAFNFFIYILANASFRKDLKHILKKPRQVLCSVKPRQHQSAGKSVTAATPQSDRSKVESTELLAASNTSIDNRKLTNPVPDNIKGTNHDLDDIKITNPAGDNIKLTKLTRQSALDL